MAAVFLFHLSLSLNFKTGSVPDETSPEPSIYTGPAKTGMMPDGKDLIEDYSGRDFETNSEDFSIIYRPLSRRTGMNVQRTDGTGPLSVSLSKSYDKPLDLSEYNELFFRVKAEESPSLSELDISITLYSHFGSYTVGGKVPSDGIYDVYCPIDTFESRQSVTRIAITINSAKNDSVTISAIFADSLYSYSHLELFSADSFTSDNELDISRDKIDIHTDKGTAWLCASSEWVFPKDEDGENVATGSFTAKVVLSGAENGTVTFSVKKGSDEEYSDIATLTLYQGTNPYAFVFDASKGCDSYKITLSGVTPTEGDVLTLHSVGIVYFDATVREDASAYPGSITSCSLTSDGSAVRISGTVRSETVVNNITAKLGVFAIDMWDEHRTEILDAVDMTTVFEMNVATSSLRYSPALYKYFVGVVDGDEVTPVTSLAYPSVSVSPVSSGMTVLGIQSNDTSSRFLANVSHTVVDVYLDRLVRKDEGGRIHTYGDSFLYLDSSYINELDSQINFHTGTGANVYLRIISTSSLSNLPNIRTAYLYSLDSRNKNAAQNYMTALDFLISRYEKVSGIIVGKRVNCFPYNRLPGDDDIVRYAENYVNILRLTAVVIRQHSSDASVIVPFGDLYIYGVGGYSSEYVPFDPVTGVGENSADPVILSNLISQIIAKSGGFQWHFMYECEKDPAGAMTYAYKTANQLIQGNGTSPRGHMVLWQPEGEISESDALAFAAAAADAAVTLNTSAAILSLVSQNGDDGDICAALVDTAMETFPDRKIISAEAYSVNEKVSSEKTVFLWDFRNSYSSEGFIFGGSVSSMYTENLPVFSEYEKVDNCRGLHSVIDPALGNSALLYSPFGSAKNLSYASYVDLTLNIESDAENTYTVKIIFGKGVSRFEFTGEVTSGEPVTLRCKTGREDLDFDAEYMAISVDTEDAITLDVSKVTAFSKAMTASELSLAMNRETEKKDTSRGTSITVILILSSCMTVVIFVLLSIRPESSVRRVKSSDKREQSRWE